MNKLCYRVVFNKSRGLLMAVQEIARSHGKGASGASTAAPDRGVLTGTLRRMALTVASAFGATFVIAGLAAAQIVADPNAPGRQQATVLNAANGVLQVNVQTPSAAGVSRNVYNRFDVAKSGAILNNSRAAVQTQLGGWVDANPWMAKGMAKVILNEVSSANPSQLRGYVEVAGQKAEVVIANAAGIVVDGGGFINVSRATLTTGAPVLSADGALTGYTVQRGLISVEGEGMDGRQSDYTTLIARSVQLNAGIWAQQLEVLTGANQVTLPDETTGGVATLAPVTGVGDVPRYGIDTALLGGMYANRITLVGTEAGVGVRNAGNLGAAAGELVVTTEGRLENLGSIAASKALALKALDGVGNSGSVYGEAAVSVQAGASIDNRGTVYAGGMLDLSTQAALQNSGTISAGAGLRLAAGSLQNSKLISSGTRADITVQGDIDNRNAVIQAQSLALDSVVGSVDNTSGKIVQSGAVLLDIVADALMNSNGGQVGAVPAGSDGSGNGGGDSGSGAGVGDGTGNGGAGAGPGGSATGTDGGSNTGNNTGSGTGSDAGADSGTGAGAVTPVQLADGHLHIANTINNNGGQIMSGGAIGLNVHALDNAGGQLNLSSLNVNGAEFSNRAGKISVLNDFTLRTGVFDNNGGTVLVGGKFDGQSQAFDNSSGLLSSGRQLQLRSGPIDNSSGKIVSAGTSVINVGGTVDNQGGYIQSVSGLTLGASGRLNNRSGTVETIGADGTLQIHASDIDNSSGRIANAGSGASAVRSDTNLLNAGTIGANGALAVHAQTMQNQSGATLQAGGGLELGVTHQLDNPGAISSGGGINFVQADASLNNAGQIAASGNIRIDIRRANNDGGQIGTTAGSGADVTLSAREVSNSSGQLIADRDLSLTVRDSGLNNTNGMVHAGRDGNVAIAQTLWNQHGVIETVGSDSKLALTAGAIQNIDGKIINAGTGDSVLHATGDVINSGTIAGNGRLSLHAGSLINQATVASGGKMALALDSLLDNRAQVSSGGALQIDVAGGEILNPGEIYAAGNINLLARTISNAGDIGTTASSNAYINVVATDFDNSDGSLIASGDARLTVDGKVGNQAGLIRAGRNLTLRVAGDLDNQAGIIESVGTDSTLNVRAHQMDNTTGRIVNVGGGHAQVTAQTDIQNGGVIAGNGMLTVSADKLINTIGGSVASGSDLVLDIVGRLENDGVIQSGGALISNQATQQLNNRSDIISAGNMKLRAELLNNNGGRIATATTSGATLGISAGVLSNQYGAMLSDGAADIVVRDTLDNRAGVVQSRGDQALSVGGLLDNRAGIVEVLGTTSGLQMQAGAINNSDGRIVNAGNGDSTISSASYIQNNNVIGTNGNLALNALVVDNAASGAITAGANMALGVRDALTNSGIISSKGGMTSTLATGTLTNSAQIIAGRDVQLAAGTLNNDGGQIATLKQSQADVTITADRVSNQSGVILSDRNASLAVTGAVDNAQGLLQAGQNLDITAGGTLGNASGTIEAIAADSTLQVHAGEIDNGSGRIINVGTAATAISAQGGISSSGTIAGNGMLQLDAQSLRNNASGLVQSGQQLQLSLSQRLDNGGAISSGDTLDFLQTTDQIINSGSITSAAQATIHAGSLNNDGGQIATLSNSNADIVIDSLSMSNRAGRILANGNAAIGVAGTLDNAQGALQAGRDLRLRAGGALGNTGGVIETAAAGSTLNVQALSIDNTGGRIANIGTGATNITSETSLISSGMIAGNGDLIISALTAQNKAGGTLASGGNLLLDVAQQMQNAGTISSAGTLNFNQLGASFSNSGQVISGRDMVFRSAAFSNDGGQIATAGGSGASIAVDSGSISNRSGKIVASGNASVSSDTGLNNSSGTLQAGQHMDVRASGALNNSNGAIEAGGTTSTLEIRAASVDSSAGRIVNVGTGNTVVHADSSIINSGTLAGNGDVMLKAQTLTNNSGGAIGAGGDLELAVASKMSNHAAITSSGELHFDQAAADLVNDGQIAAGRGALIVANSVINDNGQMATARGGAADLILTTNSLSNVKGQILADGNATLAIAGALDNKLGTIQSVGDLALKVTGALGNDAGAIEAAGATARLMLEAQSIDNGSGRIANIGSGDLNVSSQGAITNNGTIGGNGNLLIKSTTLQSGANGNIASGKNMDLQVTQQLANQGKINSAGTLTFNQAAAVLNNSGAIVSAGNALIVAKNVNNDGGRLGTGVGTEGDLSLTTDQLSNEAGHITTGRDLTVVTHGMQGNGELQGGRDLSLTMDGDYTQSNGTQQFHSNRDLSLTVTGNITNNATLEAVRNLSLSGNNVVNNAGAVIQGQDVAIKAAGDLNNAGEISGRGQLQIVSGGTVDNRNAMVGGDLTLLAQNLNNSGASTLLGATGSIALGVAGTVNNTGGATIYSAGALSISAADGGATGLVNNISSTIEAAGDLGLNATTLNNIRENVTLVKVETVNETKLMTLPSWYHHGDNHNRYETSAANYYPHEVYFVNPADVLENEILVGPDGNTYGRAVIRTHANDSAFFSASTGLYGAYGSRSRITMTDGTMVLFYHTSSDNQPNPDQGGPADSAYQYAGNVTNWIDGPPSFSNQYGSCTSNCIRFVTQPDYNDPTTTISRETLRSLAPLANKLETTRLAHHVALEDQIAPGSGAKAQILSGGNMNLTVGQALLNQYGDIMATGTLNIGGSAAISNEGATLYRVHNFDGTWTTDAGDRTAYTMPSLSEVIGTAAGTISGGKGVSITGRSFANVDVNAGTAGNIRDSVNVLATGNNTATGVSIARGGNASGGSTAGRVDRSGIGNNAGAGAWVNGSGTGNNAQTRLDTGGSGMQNTAKDADATRASLNGNSAAVNGNADGSGTHAGALGNISTRGGASQAQTASQVGGNANAIKVAPNGLSTINPDAKGAYLFETRAQFANHGNWISSDYLLKALDMDPATTQKRLGDGFYEQRMVREQLIELTGRAPTDGLSDDSRYKDLLTSGISFAEEYKLRPGIALTADQIAHLTSDIVWMETQTVSLPDGTVEQVLVPKVYLAHAGNDAVKPGGALLTGNGVSITTSESIVNSGGVIDGGNGRTVLMAGQDIVNKGGAINGGEMLLSAGGDVINQSLTIKQDYASVNTSGNYTSLSNQASITASGPLSIGAARDLVDTGGTITAASADITAGRDISFNALQTGSTYASQVSGYTENNSSTTYKVGQINTSGDLHLGATQDLKLGGTQVAVGGAGTLIAGRDIAIAAVVNEVKTSQQNDPGSKTYDKQVHENQTVVGANVAAGGNLTLSAGMLQTGNVAIAGSALSAGGPVTLSATGDVSITQVQERHLSDTASHRESSSVFKKSSDTAADYSDTRAVVGSSVGGDAVTVKSGNDIMITGSQLTADNALTLNASRDLLVSSAAQSNTEQHSEEHKKSGFSLDITEGLGYSKTQNKNASNGDTVTQVGSVLSAGSISATSGRDTSIKGSTVVADGDISIDAKRDLSIVSAADSFDGETSSSTKQSGSIGTRFQAAIGTVKTTNDGTQDSVTQVGSQIASLGGDVKLTAGERYTQTSSDVKAPAGDIAISAKDVLINSATNINSSTDHSTYGKTAIGGTITAPVVGDLQNIANMAGAAKDTGDSRMQALAALNMAASAANLPTSVTAVKDAGLHVSISLGNSKSDSKVVTSTETAVGSGVVAGGNVSITATGAGKDSNLTAIGSEISAGGNVDLKADNDVNLLAAQNTASQHSTNNSSGSSIGIGFGIGGTSNGFTLELAASKARGNADGDDISYSNTHVNAGGKVNVTSGGDTTLKGAVISGDSVVAQIEGDLNIESLQDSSKFDSKQRSSGFNASLCIPPACYGASSVGVSVGKSAVNGDFLSVIEQSGIKTGDGGFQVTVAGNTDLKGGVLSSSQAAIDQGSNLLTTGSLTASDLHNTDSYAASGYSLSASVSVKLRDQSSVPEEKSKNWTADQKAAALANGRPSASAGVASVRGDHAGTTVSGISGGVILITDQTKQAGTGHDVATVIAELNTGVTTENANSGSLKKAWEAEQLQKEIDTRIAITQEFSKQAPKAIAVFADSQAAKIRVAKGDEEEAKKWDEGGIYRIALHTAAGALSGGSEGGTGALTAASAANELDKLQKQLALVLTENGIGQSSANAVAQAVAEATSLLAGAAVGGTSGAATSFATDTNNRQLTSVEEKLLARQQEGETEEEKRKLADAACALVRCADGLSDLNPAKAALLEQQARGEKYIVEQSVLLRTGSFTSSLFDKATDKLMSAASWISYTKSDIETDIIKLAYQVAVNGPYKVPVTPFDLPSDFSGPSGPTSGGAGALVMPLPACLAAGPGCVPVMVGVPGSVRPFPANAIFSSGSNTGGGNSSTQNSSADGGVSGSNYSANSPSQISVNYKNGIDFENKLINFFSFIGAKKNTTPETITLANGKTVVTVPDLWLGGIMEAKNVINLSNTEQLRAQAAIAMSKGQEYNLIVSPRTKTVSSKLVESVKLTGGNIYVFDPVKKTLVKFK